MKLLLSLFMLLLFICSSTQQPDRHNDFVYHAKWQTGHDEGTVQLFPANGIDPVATENKQRLVHVKFNVKQYGEVSFPLNPETPENGEALKTNLSKKKSITLIYQSNEEFVLQLRQTGVHGGIHNHVTIPASMDFKTISIPFTQFKGGKTSLDLTDVSKFNFAFLFNNKEHGYSELKILSFVIED